MGRHLGLSRVAQPCARHVRRPLGRPPNWSLGHPWWTSSVDLATNVRIRTYSWPFLASTHRQESNERLNYGNSAGPRWSHGTF